MFLVDFGGVFGTLDLRKLVSRISEVLIFKNSSFSCLGCLFVDFVTFWDALGARFGSKHGAKMRSKFDQKVE